MAVQLEWEKKLLLGTTAGTVFAFLIQVVALGTNHWLTFEIPNGLYVNKTGKYLYESYSGLWRICITEFTKNNKGERIYQETCRDHNLFPTEMELYHDHTLDMKILDYMRTGTAFGIIAVTVMVIGHMFAFYALRRPRYIVKRLTALIHFMTAACVLVENEVFIRRTEYAKTKLPLRLPKEADHSYGYSFVLSWICFVIFLGAGCVFLFSSHKRKADNLNDELDDLEIDEPIAIRR
ncbi:voltage-dependent calcium channel gamma-3 subunit-like [Mytilus edulis]|uniref:CACNG5 n=1 Tax=Mytilus edulis TaxID=6550 RepID=A0A8S3TGI3_MYTED|nr:CACNG5 [Mytilus edulis]